MKDKFEKAIIKECCVIEAPDGSFSVGFTKNAANACDTLHQQVLLKAEKKAWIEGSNAAHKLTEQAMKEAKEKAFEKGYAEGYENASNEAAEEIHRNYTPIT